MEVTTMSSIQTNCLKILCRIWITIVKVFCPNFEIYIFLAKFEKEINWKGKEQQPQKSRRKIKGTQNNAHPGPNLPSNRQIITSNNKTFDTPYQVKYVKNLLIRNATLVELADKLGIYISR
jgi:hypothetical protein